MRKRIVIAIGLAILSTSCSTQVDPSSIQLSEEWTAEEEPLIGSIEDIAVSENGSVFVVDEENYAILKYDSTGSFKNQTGRRGSGPGEFGAEMRDIAIFKDTVYVVDKSNRRFNLFTTDLEYLRQVRFPQKAPPLREITVDNQGRLYGAGTGTKDDDWLLYDALRVDSSRFVELKHVHGDMVYDRFSISSSPSNGLLAISYTLKDTLEVYTSPDTHVGTFPIIRDHSHEAPPPVVRTNELAKLKSRSMPDADDFITWDLSFDQRGYIWILAGNYAKPPKQVLYVYNTEGDRISKTIAPSAIDQFIIRGSSLYAATEDATQLRKYKIRVVSR